MILKSVCVKNFKSFKKLNVELNRSNIIIGPNASGKSNFIEIFKFIRDICHFGLSNAISIQGGTQYLRNINIGSKEPLSVSIMLEGQDNRIIKKDKMIYGMKTTSVSYEFELKFKSKGSNYEIIKDQMTLYCDFVKLNKNKGKIKETNNLGNGKIIISAEKKTVNVSTDVPKDVPISKIDIIPPFFEDLRAGKDKQLLLSASIFYCPQLYSIFNYMSVYDFDPKLPKKATPITGKIDLEEDGSNLSIVLNDIIANRERKRKLTNIVKDILPFVEDLDVEKFADKSFLFKLKEVHSQNQYIPASLISDGTINITALITALYFGKEELIILEEPERNIHPQLISKVQEMIKDASEKKQIIVTTHNPQFLKNVRYGDIYLIAKDGEGFSKITKPLENDDIKIFLENEIGIEDLYIQNILEM